MRGSSLASQTAVVDRFDATLATAGSQALDLGTQLFAVVDVLASSGALRRALTNPSASATSKADLVKRVLAASCDPRVVAIVADAAGARWSKEIDFVDAVEYLGVQAILASAQNEDRLQEIGNELWEASQTLAALPAVRQAVVDPRGNAQARAELVTTLFADKLSAQPLALLRRAAAVPRGVHLVAALQRYSDLAAVRRQYSVAHVTVGAPLSASQVDRIEAFLEQTHGKKIQVDVTVDPNVVGGIRLQVGADVLDSTLLSRLAEVRRRIAS